MGVSIHNIANLQKQAAIAGASSLACLGGEIKDGTLFFKDYNGSAWVWSSDVRSMAANEVVYGLGGRTNFTIAELFPTYDWVASRGYANLATWVEAAAAAANR